jgi:hypothetical protein
MSSDPRRREMEVLLEDLSYAITAARSAGMDDIDRLRGIVRKIRDIGADLDGLAGSIVAEKQAAEH